MAASEAERHRRVAASFTRLTEGTVDWTAPSPVPAWTARDVVAHLVEWLPAFVAGGSDHTWPPGPPVEQDPVGAWRAHAAAVQAILDDPALADSPFTHPFAPADSLGQAVDRFYTSDVLMHAWDLARATGQREPEEPDDLALAADLLAGMRPVEDMLRASGQYGPAVPAPPDATPFEQLMAFVGRDPAFGRD